MWLYYNIYSFGKSYNYTWRWKQQDKLYFLLLGNHALKIIISSNTKTHLQIRAEKSIKTLRKFNVVQHLKAYIHKHSTRILSPKCNFSSKIYKPSYNFFMDQNYKPFLVQFFWQKLQTFPWHTTTQVPHKRTIELWWQLQNQLFIFIVFFCHSPLHITWCGTLVNTHLRTNTSYHSSHH